MNCPKCGLELEVVFKDEDMVDEKGNLLGIEREELLKEKKK